MRCLLMIALLLILVANPGHAQQATPLAVTPEPADHPAKENINPPKVIKSVDAYFSDDARRKKINGRCMISFTVDVSGMPQDIKVVRCTDPSFEASSLDAVEQYRFKPATTQEGKPVSVKISVEIAYHLVGVIDSGIPIHYIISSPPGTTTSESGPDGVYPLTSLVTPPTMTRFSDEGYGHEVFVHEGNGACDVVLTISAKGKASDPQVIHCERHVLEKPAIQSLLKSNYKPGKVNGKAVPIRAAIHLEYGSVSPKS